MKRIFLLFFLILSFSTLHAQLETSVVDNDRIETWHGKTIMVVTPHPDDDTFACGGIMHLLARNGNRVLVVIYTNDNKGSHDLEMTSERLARIRKAEEEAACAVLGIPKENIIWLGYDDGELEYAPAKTLCGQVTRLIRKYRPDALFSIDPGETYEQWHKSDHRMAAMNTMDAVRAAEWHLYYPEHLLVEGLQPYTVPIVYLYYSANPNYWVDVTDIIDLKMQAALKHVSQLGGAVDKYRDYLTEEEKAQTIAFFKKLHAQAGKKAGVKYAEAFRKARY